MYRKSTHPGAALRRSFAARAALAVALAERDGVRRRRRCRPPPWPRKGRSAQGGRQFARRSPTPMRPFQAIVNNPAGDLAAAKAMVPAVVAAVQNQTDKSTLGTALISLGSKLKDIAMQTQGIQLALDSGKTNPAQVGAVPLLPRQVAYEAKNYAEARTQFQAAQQAGYTENDPRPAIAETYFGAGQSAEGPEVPDDVIKQEQAAGKTIPNNWLLRGLQVAYKAKLAPQATEYSVHAGQDYPTPAELARRVAGVGAINPFDQRAARPAAADARDRSDEGSAAITSNISGGRSRRLAGEVLEVLDEGVKAGALHDQRHGLYRSQGHRDDRAWRPTARTLRACSPTPRARPTARSRRAPAMRFIRSATMPRRPRCTSWRSTRA